MLRRRDEIADLEKRMVALRGELATFIQSDGLASRFIDDEPLGDALISPVEHLSPPAGKGNQPKRRRTWIRGRQGFEYSLRES